MDIFGDTGLEEVTKKIYQEIGIVKTLKPGANAAQTCHEPQHSCCVRCDFGLMKNKMRGTGQESCKISVLEITKLGISSS